MAKRRDERKNRHPLLWWTLLLAWICVIWGHSLKPGAASDAQSYQVVGILQRVAAWLALQDNPTVSTILQEHPGIIRILSDPALTNHYVRKGAHFAEYFVLGILVFKAVRAALTNPAASLLLMGVLWAGVPYLDETIQRYVPNRSGQLSDVLLDMSGAGTALLLCAFFAGLAAVFAPRERDLGTAA